MAAAAPPPTRWTDERLDDQTDRLGRFEARVDRRFDKVDDRFDKVDDRFDKVDDRFDKVDDRFDKMDARFDRADAVEAARFAAVHDGIATVSSQMDKMNRRLTSGLITVVGAVIIKVFLG